MLTFPKRLLYMAMQAYLSKRTLFAGEMVGDSIQPTHGIFAKCSLGIRRARVVLNDLGGTPIALPITLPNTRPAFLVFSGSLEFRAGCDRRVEADQCLMRLLTRLHPHWVPHLPL